MFLSCPKRSGYYSKMEKETIQEISSRNSKIQHRTARIDRNNGFYERQSLIEHALNITRRIATKGRHTALRFQTGMLPMGRPVGTVAINMYPTASAWGGSSVFIQQLVTFLRRFGFKVVFDLRRVVDVIFIIDPRDDLQNKAFGMREVLGYKQVHPEVRIVHRINECDKRKETDHMDELLRHANEIADHTVFISKWLRDYFVKRWFDPQRTHSVIYNGADPAVFHPIGGANFQVDGVLRLVTHHWSSNPLKGFPLYGRLDALIADGLLTKTELWVIGRWPADMHWRAARTFPPASGKRLAALLRQCHVYITASLWEPCGMHHVEGAQCGLPLLYHEDGGGIVEVCRKYGIGFQEEDLVLAVGEMRVRYQEMRRRVFDSMPNGIAMATEYVRLVQRIMAEDEWKKPKMTI